MSGKSISSKGNQHYRRSGISLIWATMILVVLTGLASFAVDYGRVRLARTQLRSACDAAALAAGQHVLSDPIAARNAAIAVAKANRADGQPVELTTTDVQFVKWDADNFSYQVMTGTNVSKANAVLVTAHRTTARGNPIDLPFAKIVGKETCDVTATAIAMATPRKHGVVGLDFIKMTGDSFAGTVARDGRGSMASNGNITLGGSSTVDGDAHPGVGKSVIGANHVNGSTTPLTAPLVYPPANPGNAATLNDNGKIPGLKKGSLILGSQQRLELGEGVYYIKDLQLGAGSELRFTAPATVYVTGNVELKGHAKITSVKAEETKLTMLSTATMTMQINGNTRIEADIYAPNAALTMQGTGDIYGTMVFKSIDNSGNTGLHYANGRRGGVVLVK